LSLGCALRQKTVGIDVIQQVAADFDLSHLRSEPGVTHHSPETIALGSAASEAQALLTRSNPVPAPAPVKTRSDELSNPEEALAYIQEFIRRFKKDQYFAN
jgi:hypothetical protein